jgi:hypothetical protein
MHDAELDAQLITVEFSSDEKDLLLEYACDMAASVLSQARRKSLLSTAIRAGAHFLAPIWTCFMVL